MALRSPSSTLASGNTESLHPSLNPIVIASLNCLYLGLLSMSTVLLCKTFWQYAIGQIQLVAKDWVFVGFYCFPSALSCLLFSVYFIYCLIVRRDNEFRLHTNPARTVFLYALKIIPFHTGQSISPYLDCGFYLASIWWLALIPLIVIFTLCNSDDDREESFIALKIQFLIAMLSVKVCTFH